MDLQVDEQARSDQADIQQDLAAARKKQNVAREKQQTFTTMLEKRKALEKKAKSSNDAHKEFSAKDKSLYSKKLDDITAKVEKWRRTRQSAQIQAAKLEEASERLTKKVAARAAKKGFGLESETVNGNIITNYSSVCARGLTVQPKYRNEEQIGFEFRQLLTTLNGIKFISLPKVTSMMRRYKEAVLQGSPMYYLIVQFFDHLSIRRRSITKSGLIGMMRPMLVDTADQRTCDELLREVLADHKSDFSGLPADNDARVYKLLENGNHKKFIGKDVVRGIKPNTFRKVKNHNLIVKMNARKEYNDLKHKLNNGRGRGDRFQHKKKQFFYLECWLPLLFNIK